MPRNADGACSSPRREHPRLCTIGSTDGSCYSRIATPRIAAGRHNAICAYNSVSYGVVFLGALRAGVAVAPLAPSLMPTAISSMITDCDAKILFLDQAVATALAGVELPKNL